MVRTCNRTFLAYDLEQREFAGRSVESGMGRAGEHGCTGGSDPRLLMTDLLILLIRVLPRWIRGDLRNVNSRDVGWSRGWAEQDSTDAQDERIHVYS